MFEDPLAIEYSSMMDSSEESDSSENVANTVIHSKHEKVKSFLPDPLLLLNSTVKATIVSDEKPTEIVEAFDVEKDKLRNKELLVRNTPGAFEHDRQYEFPAKETTKSKKKNKTVEKVKDKVKAQRLKGQAGIGSDFKTWKSDGEMLLRQQFD